MFFSFKKKQSWEILQILVRISEYLINCDFLQKLYNNDPYHYENILKFWLKSVNNNGWISGKRKIINFSWNNVIKNDNVTILRCAQQQQISLWWAKFSCNQSSRFWGIAVTHKQTHIHTDFLSKYYGMHVPCAFHLRADREHIHVHLACIKQENKYILETMKALQVLKDCTNNSTLTNIQMKHSSFLFIHLFSFW